MSRSTPKMWIDFNTSLIEQLVFFPIKRPLSKDPLEIPLIEQLTFVPIEWDKTKNDKKDKFYIDPICLSCKCDIIKHFWSPEVKYTRRSGLRLRERTPLEVEVISDPTVGRVSEW